MAINHSRCLLLGASLIAGCVSMQLAPPQAKGSPAGGNLLERKRELGTSHLTTWRQALREDPLLFEGCSKVFLDVGSNRGTHVRKLFEPHKYKDCPYLPLFDEAFGPPKSRKKAFAKTGLCAFGFEGNPRWAFTLQTLERAYAEQGWRVKWFTPELVSNVSGNATFWLPDAGEEESDWGASMVKPRDAQNATRLVVPEMDFPEFLQELNRSAPPGHRLMKMDIEGAEFAVLPGFVKKQLLCKDVLNTLTIEWHLYKGQEFISNKKKRKALIDLVNNSNKCKSGRATSVTEFDDESFRDDGMPLPDGTYLDQSVLSAGATVFDKQSLQDDGKHLHDGTYLSEKSFATFGAESSSISWIVALASSLAFLNPSRGSI